MVRTDTSSAYADVHMEHCVFEAFLSQGKDHTAIFHAYSTLLNGTTEGSELWHTLRARAQLGVTKGTLPDA
jgi:hypothetical protein